MISSACQLGREETSYILSNIVYLGILNEIEQMIPGIKLYLEKRST